MSVLRIEEIESALISRILDKVAYLKQANFYDAGEPVAADLLRRMQNRSPSLFIMYSGSRYGAEEDYEDRVIVDTTSIFTVMVVVQHLRNADVRKAGWSSSGLTPPTLSKQAGIYDIFYDVGAALGASRLDQDLKMVKVVSDEVLASTDLAVAGQIMVEVNYDKEIIKDGTCIS